jgi:Leucine-rich repeat (LRR) protein
VSDTQLTTLAPFALLSNVTKLAVKGVKKLNIAPLAGLRKVRSADFTYSEIADLSPLAGMSELEDIDFYGAELTDFSPLASCPKLDRVNFYAAKLPPAGYASLGTLKQVKKFHGGLTKMTSIEWMKQVPQAEEVKIFAEKIPDLTPIGSLPNLTYLRLWNMDGGSLSTAVGDLAFLSGNKKLKKLELPGSRYVNTDVLAALPLLETVDLYGAKNPVSVTFATRLPKLKILGLGGATVTDGAVVASLPKTVRVRTDKKTQGVPETK